MRTPVYGLTGGIASGKSTILEQLAALDIDILDTDQLARDVIAPGTPGAQELEAAIGSKYFPGGYLDRVLLRSRIYESPVLKQMVESIIHPLVRHAVNRWLNEESVSPYRILCSPLLIETKQHDSLDGVIVVDVSEGDQRLRGTTRDTQSRETIQHIIEAQLPRDTRLSHATFVVDNSGDLKSLTQQIQTLHEKLSHDR